MCPRHITQLDNDCCTDVCWAFSRDFPFQFGCEILFQKPASGIPPSYFNSPPLTEKTSGRFLDYFTMLPINTGVAKKNIFWNTVL